MRPKCRRTDHGEMQVRCTQPLNATLAPRMVYSEVISCIKATSRDSKNVISRYAQHTNTWAQTSEAAANKEPWLLDAPCFTFELLFAATNLPEG